MKNAFAPALLVLVLTILSTAQTQTAKPLSVAPEQVQRVEILYFPERVLVRAALSPERLEHLYRYKLEIRDVRESAEWQLLPSLLRETSVKPSGHAYDHRTAVLLFDKDGRRIAAVYFDQFGYFGEVPTREHRQIMTAILEHNPDAARRHMHDHIIQSKGKVLRLTDSSAVRP